MSEIIEMPCGTGKTVGIWRTICLPSYPPQYRYECSNCHSQVKEPSNSCPNCKAEMKFFPEDFFKAYTEVQLDVEMKRKQCRKACFVNSRYSCRCADCLLVNSKDCPEYKESRR